MDSPLTELGRRESAARRAEASLLSPELVIVSPLVRAVQTACLSFADHGPPGNNGDEENDRGGSVPWVAHEGCREQLGLLTCNKRRPLSETAADFPSINFDLVDSEDDVLWHPSIRERPLDESDRIYCFLVDFVRNRPEKEIAVVGHSAWLFNMCNAVVDCGGDESLTSWFSTSEIRSMSLSFSDRK